MWTKRKPKPPISPLTEPMYLVADEVLAWAKITGEPVTPGMITHMTVTMHRRKMIKACPPMAAVRGVVLRWATDRGVRVAPLIPPPTDPRGEQPDAPDWPDLDKII